MHQGSGALHYQRHSSWYDFTDTTEAFSTYRWSSSLISVCWDYNWDRSSFMMTDLSAYACTARFETRSAGIGLRLGRTDLEYVYHYKFDHLAIVSTHLIVLLNLEPQGGGYHRFDAQPGRIVPDYRYHAS